MTKGVFTFSPAACPAEAFSWIAPAYTRRRRSYPELRRCSTSGGRMARITRAAAHLSAEEVKRHMKTAKMAMYRQRWLIIYTALVALRQGRRHRQTVRGLQSDGACIDLDLQSAGHRGGGHALQGRPSPGSSHG